MNKADVFEIIAIGETAEIEFSHDDLSADRLAKTSVSFANHLGGRILLGVHDDVTEPESDATGDHLKVVMQKRQRPVGARG